MIKRLLFSFFCASCAFSFPSGLLLPYGGRTAEYISTDGSSYFDTGIPMNDISSVRMDVEVYPYSYEEYSFFGATDSSGDSNQSIIGATSDNFVMYNKGNLLSATGGEYFSSTYRHSISSVWNNTGSVLNIDGTEYTSSFTPEQSSSSVNAYLFSRNSNGTPDKPTYSSTKLYSCSIYSNDVAVRDFVPVVVTNTVCLYDKISKKYFYNSGSGSFTAGNIGTYIPNTNDVGIKIEVKMTDDNKTLFIPQFAYGKFSVDWGDGESNVYEANVDEDAYISNGIYTITNHVYQNSGNYIVTIDTLSESAIGELRKKNMSDYGNFTYSIDMLRQYYTNHIVNILSINPSSKTRLAHFTDGLIMLPENMIVYVGDNITDFGNNNIYNGYTFVKNLDIYGGKNIEYLFSIAHNSTELTNITFNSEMGNLTSLVSFHCRPIFTWYNNDGKPTKLKTIKFLYELPNITNIESLCNGLSALTNIEFQGKSLKITNAKDIFRGASSYENDNVLEHFPNIKTADSMFYSCSKLKSIDLKKLQNLEFDANSFNGCSSIGSIDLSNLKKVTNLGATFSGCNGLSEIHLTGLDSIKSLENTFNGCKGLKNIYFENLTNSYISLNSTFNGCASLTNVVFSTNNVSTLNFSSAFVSCTSLKEIDFPNCYSNIESFYCCFDGCTSLTNASLSEKMPLLQTMEYCFRNNTSIETIEFPKYTPELTSLYGTCYSCSKLKKVTYIEDAPKIATMGYMFYGCSSLEDYAFPKYTPNLTSVLYTFNNCSSLKTVIMPHYLPSVTSMARLFNNCNKMQYVRLPYNIPQIKVYGSRFAGTFLYNMPNLEIYMPKWFSGITHAGYSYVNLPRLKGVTRGLATNAMPSRITSYSGSVSTLPDNVRKYFSTAWGGTWDGTSEYPKPPPKMFIHSPFQSMGEKE